MKLLPWEYAVRNMTRSPLRMGLSIAGAVLVVLLALAAGGFVRGMQKSLNSSAVAGNVILLGAGSEESVERSEIRPDAGGQALATITGIKSRLGVPYVSPEVHLMTALKTSPDATHEMQSMLRGVTPPAFLVHPQVRVVEGRAPEAGRDEMMVGRMAATQMGVPEAQLAVGKTLYFDKRPWTITGKFEAPNTVMESEVWLPLRDLQIAARRDNLSCVILTLDDGGDFADVDLFVKQRLDLELIAMREGEYYSKLSQFFQPIQIMVWVTAVLIAMGGLFGGLNTMYAAFAMRVREMGSLQAIGYTRLSLVVSLIQESVLAASIGALLAAGIGVLFLDGLAVRFSMGAFGLTLDSSVVGLALLAGLFLGVVGALPPAWRCLRLPIAEALKSA